MPPDRKDRLLGLLFAVGAVALTLAWVAALGAGASWLLGLGG
jgi:hypothetical protein